MSTQTTVTDDAYVAFRVRYELTKRKMSVRKLARELDMSPSKLQRRVSAHVPFRTDEIQDIAEMLGVEVACFFPPTQSQARAS